jgi:hypothetical protein
MRVACAIVLAALTMSACSSSPARDTSKPVTCASLVGDSHWAKIADDQGCTVGNTVYRALSGLNCGKGVLLVQIDKYYGRTDGKLYAAKSSLALVNDTRYKAMYQDCQQPK